MLPDRIDVLKISVPLMEKLLEEARENFKTDIDVHKMTERLISLSKTKPVLNASDFEKIIDYPEELKELRKLSGTNRR